MKRTLPIRALAGWLVLSACALHAADYATLLSSLNPLGYWKLNEPSGSFESGTAANSGSLGAAGNGAFYLSPALQQPGALTTDPAMNLNGFSQFVEVPYAPELNPSGPFTVEFWANLTNASAGAKSGVVSRYIGGSGQRGYLFFVNNGNTKWQFRVYNGTAGVTCTDVDGPDIIADAWHHVVGVFDGTEIRIYVNGAQNSPGVVGTCAANTNAPLRLGAGTTETGPTLFFPGLLDEVAIYPTALTTERIAERYALAFNDPTAYAASVLADNPTAYWRLNEGTLPPAPKAANSGSLGSEYDGDYTFGIVPGIEGPRQPQFAGMTPDNHAVQLNGSSAVVNVPNLPLLSDTVTLTCWLKRNGSQGSFAGILFTRPVATGLSFDGANRLAYTWNDDPATYNFNSTLTVPDGIWTFAALVVRPEDAVIYMGTTNGLVSRTNTPPAGHGSHDFSSALLWLGRDQAGTRYFKGELDEAAIFDRALDFDSISNLFYSATPAVPTITRTPADPVYEGMTIDLTAYGVATGPLNYQWRKDGAPLAGKTTPSLTLSNVTTNDSGDYDVVVTLGANSATSAVSRLTVSAGPPVIFVEPLGGTRFVGGTLNLAVDAGGSVPLTYQWFKGTDPIPDATNASYVIAPVRMEDAGSYSVTITNPYGTKPSSPASLEVLPVTGYAATVMNRHPDSYWRLDETSGTTAFDYAGGVSGSFPAPSAVVLGNPGPRPPALAGFEDTNTGYQLDGANGWVTLPALNWNTDTVTFTAWVNLAAYDDDLSGVVFSRGTSASGLHIISSGELRYHWSGGQWGFSSGLTVPLNTWTFVALVVEPGRATLYMGDATGLASAENATAHGATPLADPLYLGRDRTDRPVAGMIDEVAIFKRALSASDINTLYAIGTGAELELALGPGLLLPDTKPEGILHHGVNAGSTYVATSTDVGAPARTRTGVQQFSAAEGAQVRIAADPDFNSATGTFAFWMRFDGANGIPEPGSEGAILVDRRTSVGTVLVLDDFGGLFVQCSGGANSFSAGTLADNLWHHVAVTYDQSATGSITVYVDGSPIASSPNNAAWSWPASQPIELGRSHDDYWKRFDGQMDDFRIYNRVLSDTEVASIASSDALVDPAALKVRLNFDSGAVGYSITWPFGQLESSPTLGPGAVWTPIPGASSPYPFLPSGENNFFRAQP